MRAAILSIGDEVILGQNLDTNTAWLAAELAARSVMAVEHRTVSDDRAAIAAAFRDLAGRADIVISTGGLGPTDDDLTRDALHDLLDHDAPMQTDETALAWLDEWFAAQGRDMPENNLRQAQRPASMRCLKNENGTAPGLSGRLGDCLLFALPGPPREMHPMFRESVVGQLAQHLGDEQAPALLTAMVKCYGIGESEAARRLGDLTDRQRNPLIGTTVSDSVISARIRAFGPAADMQPMIDRDVQAVERAWHPYAFGLGETSLAASLGQLLLSEGKSLVTAESCTGGWLGKMLVDVPGSSSYYLGGWVTYADDMKTNLLAVSHELLRAHGAVSREVAEAMASGALANIDADYALAITGIAGPGGGTPSKPVGTVYIALAQLEDSLVTSTARRFHFTGDRLTIRDRSAKAAMQMLRFALLDVPDTPLLWQEQETRSAGSTTRSES